MNEGLLRTPFSLTEARILYELAQRGKATASELIPGLGVDPGYMSRIVGGFQKRKLISRVPAEADARQSGQEAFAALNVR